jgi:hypothetical protein
MVRGAGSLCRRNGNFFGFVLRKSNGCSTDDPPNGRDERAWLLNPEKPKAGQPAIAQISHRTQVKLANLERLFREAR